MKTKKTYTHFKIALFMGLLSFHTFSSCVNSGAKLGMGMIQSKAAKQKKEKKKKLKELEVLLSADVHNKGKCDTLASCIICKQEYQKEYPYLHCLQSNSRKIIVVSVCGVLSFIMAGGAWYYINYVAAPGLIQNRAISSDIGNHTAVLAPGLSNNVSTVLGPLQNTTQDLATIGAVAVVNVTGLLGLLNNSRVTNATLTRENAVGSRTNLGMANLPSSSTVRPCRTSILSQEAMDHIKHNKFSKASIQHCFDKDPCILNAKVPKAPDLHGETLLISVIGQDKLEAVQWLLKHGADPNKPNDQGYSPIRHVNPNNPNGKLIFDYLLEYGADVCKQDLNGKRIGDKSGLESWGTPALIEAVKKCPKKQ